ncbi:MAG: hypothetical protein HWE33_11990 [Rhodobacteraceae bacterium]|nr:hypothetical protein [Paracoccaceae bacterium]
MASTQEFNEADALTAAMHAFRKYGYAGVSIKTLEAETELSSGSIPPSSSTIAERLSRGS